MSGEATTPVKDLPKIAGSLKEEITQEHQLKHTKTREPLSGEELAKTEINQKGIKKEVSDFDKATLKHAETEEKNPLPDKEAIGQEAEFLKFKDGIEHFDKDKLMKTSTTEKNNLPTKEDIELEKKA